MPRHHQPLYWILPCLVLGCFALTLEWLAAQTDPGPAVESAPSVAPGADASGSLAPSPQSPAPSADAKETEWSRWIAEQLGGEAEHQTYNQRRVDVLTSGLAIEVEWCRREKVTEAIDQASYYGVATGRDSAVVLLVGRGDYSDERLVYDQAVKAATRSRVKAVAVLDVRDPDIGKLCEHLGLVPTDCWPPRTLRNSGDR